MMIMSSTQVILPSFEPIMITGSQYILLDKKKREYTKQAAEELGEKDSIYTDALSSRDQSESSLKVSSNNNNNHLTFSVTSSK